MHDVITIRLQYNTTMTRLRRVATSMTRARYEFDMSALWRWVTSMTKKLTQKLQTKHSELVWSVAWSQRSGRWSGDGIPQDVGSLEGGSPQRHSPWGCQEANPPKTGVWGGALRIHANFAYLAKHLAGDSAYNSSTGYFIVLWQITCSAHLVWHMAGPILANMDAAPLCYDNHSPRTYDKKCHHRNNPK